MKNKFIVCVLLILSAYAKSQSLPGLKLEPFAEGFSFPIDITNCGDERLFVAERLGKIWILDTDGNKSTEPFLDITDRVFTVFPKEYDERGLLGITFHPAYPDSPYLYINYTGYDSNSHISRFTVDPTNPNKALKSSEVIMLIVQQPKDPEYVNHKGGCLKFGSDGYLYCGLGDGGSAGDPMNNAQNGNVLLGKMLRIDINKPDETNNKKYSIPPTNPFIGKMGVRPEIWATGLRNPYRFSFDRKTGVLWLPDVGQDKWEEINYISPASKGGKNFGWSCYEGNHNFKFNNCDYNGTKYSFPIIEYKHVILPCQSITGGYVYRGSKYPNLYGKYVYCDYCTGRFSIVFKVNNSWVNSFNLDEDDLSYVGFGENKEGELFVVNAVSGEIEHIADTTSSNSFAGTFTEDDISINNNAHDLKIYPNPNHGQFTIELRAIENEKYQIFITNSMGQQIIAVTKTSMQGINKWQFSYPQLQKGVYLLNVQTTNKTITQKFVVE